jgi:glycosyltransferase involved in cell wall biosynthesis
MHDTIIVVPCFNEEKRIDVASFLALAAGVRLLFVNDGSTDGTEALLRSLVSRGEGHIESFSLAQNSGKAEAVREGMCRAAESGAAWVGFADSDLATPVEEILRLVTLAHAGSAEVVVGSRVALAGTQIERKAARHYLGRVFATAASLALDARFYDTQCGAKVFKNTPLLRAALAEPFRSQWIFDVELLGRLLTGVGEHSGLNAADFLEMPLRRWADVGGSKLRLSSWVRAAVDLGVIASDLARRRR